MNEEQQAYLKDFLENLTEERGRGFAFGTIVCAAEHREGVENALLGVGASVLGVGADQHPDELLTVLARRVEKAQASAIVITETLPPKLVDQLHHINKGNMHVQLAGQVEPITINPLPQGGMLVLLLVDVEPTALQIQPLINSILRL